MRSEDGDEEAGVGMRRNAWSFPYIILVLVLSGITAARLISAYTTFNGTYDEPFHIVAGMEWLDKGAYTYDLSHPPLARVAMATVPYLAGLRSHPSRNDQHSLGDAPGDGNAILLSQGHYQQALMLARLGNVPFLILACVIIFLWARRWFTPAVGIWALLLFLNLPPLLGHAALATLDLACAATFMAALYEWMRWLEEPVWRRTLVLATAVGVAFTTKFSNIAFMAVCCTMTFVYFTLDQKIGKTTVRQWRLRARQLGAAALIILLIMWASYRFSVGPLSSVGGYKPPIDKWFATRPLLYHAAQRVMDTPLPMAQLSNGLLALAYHARLGHPSYLLGEYRQTGWWYFFPVVLGVRTPLGFLLLGILGTAIAFWRIGTVRWQHAATALLPIALLLFCMTSRIDLGVRHILALYPLLALLAGYAIWSAFQHRNRMFRVVLVLLAVTVFFEACMAHPDYLAYFNQIAGDHPEKVLAESDLDWGQDLRRLSLRLHGLGVKDIGIRYFGTAPLQNAGLPDYRILSPTEETTGYVAVSVRYLTLENARNSSFGWLKPYKPLERIGKSIFLYRIAE